VSSNGNAQFATSDTAFTNVCLPWTTHANSIFPYWDDLRTDAQPGCAGFPGGACGIFTSTTGTAPNRIFNIEWRTVYFANNTQPANYELRLYEGQSRFDVIYGSTAQGNTGATAGVQASDTNFDQYFCNGTGTPATGGQSYILQACATPTPTVTPISISGAIIYCSNPSPDTVPGVTLSVTGDAIGSTVSDGSGAYTLSVPSGGSYTVTPTKAPLAPASDGIDTIDVVAVQRHFLNLGTPLAGCRLTAADVNGTNGVDTVDVIAIQRFFLGQTTGTGNTGRYLFSPTNRSYPGVSTPQTGQNYNTLIFGDVTPSFVQ